MGLMDSMDAYSKTRQMTLVEVERKDADGTQRWSGYRDGRTCRCHLCGVFLVPGQRAAFIYMGIGSRGGSLPVGNVFVCEGCFKPDEDEMVEAIKTHHMEATQRFWAFFDHDLLPPHPLSSDKEKS